MRRFLSGFVALALLVGVAQRAQAELLTNGNFETGTLAGWTVVDQAGGSGSFFIDTPGTTSPLSGFATAANGLGGAFYALTDQTGPGTHVLLQSFTVPGGATSVNLSFQMFANNQNDTEIVNPAGLTFTAGPNQHARVDILTAAATPFDTGAGVLANFFLGDDAGANPHAYTSYAFDITGVVGGGGTFQIRFAEVDNQFFFQQGVDNVSIEANGAVPEPASLTLLGLGAVGVFGFAWRRRRAS